MDIGKRAVWEGGIIVSLGLGLLALPATHWYRQHEREVQREAAERARQQANMSEIGSAIGELKSKWLANDNWGDELSAEHASRALYTTDLERALLVSSPLIFYGNVEDIHSTDKQGVSEIEIRVRDRKAGRLRLHLSLDASPDQTASIMKDDAFRKGPVDELSKVCIFVAGIDSVHRVEGPDIGTVVAWIQAALWIGAGVWWFVRWKYKGAPMHPALAKILNSNRLLGVLIAFGIVFSFCSLWNQMGWHIGRRKLVVNMSAYGPGNNNLKEISDQIFTDQMVPLDGFAYKNTTLINSCFTYDGGPFILESVTLLDHWKVCVKNNDLINYSDLLENLKEFRPGIKSSSKTVVKPQDPMPQ